MVNEETEKLYNLLYKQYAPRSEGEESFFGRRPNRHVKSAIGEFIKDNPKGKILDLAGGAGRHTIYAAQLGFSVEMVEISEEGINHAFRRLNELGLADRVVLHRMDMLDFLIKKSRYSGIIFHDALHFLPSQKAVEEYTLRIKEGIKERGMSYITLLTEIFLDKKQHPRRLQISLSEGVALLENIYAKSDWETSFQVEGVNKITKESGQLYTAKRIILYARKKQESPKLI